MIYKYNVPAEDIAGDYFTFDPKKYTPKNVENHIDSIYNLLDTGKLAMKYNTTPEYAEKQLHEIPIVPVVDRIEYLIEKCRGKNVLHLGCSWPINYLHKQLQPVCKKLTGIDIDVPQNISDDFFCMNLDNSDNLKEFFCSYSNFPSTVEIFLIAEILEHLGNPGHLLEYIQQYKRKDTSVIITVPNAFSSKANYHIQHGVENVNKEHVCWYSWKTLKTLVERYHFIIEDFKWYDTTDQVARNRAEGLVFLLR